LNAANDNHDDKLHNRTREVWQPRLRHVLSDDEVGQITANVTGFFSMLSEWSRADLAEPANDNCLGNAADDEGVRHDR
jgi:hypothetical protein